ncbi:MAG: ABC transporter permease, partial [Planctomycetales bacterium]|nr:ABC transporter permease [Planctomycetales bacterium]
GAAYSAEAADMFYGYYMILAFPLAIIIPFSAFRSLAAEREQNTYELLSITNLTARQIITGKLGSAVIQMVVYLSAVTPCLAFTYLLRGIDIFTIAYVISYSFFGSLGLSAVALFLGTISESRYGQVVVSVVVILGL